MKNKKLKTYKVTLTHTTYGTAEKFIEAYDQLEAEVAANEIKSEELGVKPVEGTLEVESVVQVKAMAKAAEQPPTPELDRLHAVAPYSHKIGEFLNSFLLGKGIELAVAHTHGPGCRGWDGEENRYDPSVRCKCDLEGQLESCTTSVQKLLEEFFKIDMQKVDQERQAILDHMVKTQK